MTTILITEEKAICDFCGDENKYTDKCLGCGKDMCYECRKIHGIKYRHAIVFSGSGDGYFCNECNSNPPEKVRKLHSLYRNIILLSNERENFYKQFEIRSKKVEDELEKEYEKLQRCD